MSVIQQDSAIISLKRLKQLEVKEAQYNELEEMYTEECTNKTIKVIFNKGYSYDPDIILIKSVQELEPNLNQFVKDVNEIYTLRHKSHVMLTELRSSFWKRLKFLFTKK